MSVSMLLSLFLRTLMMVSVDRERGRWNVSLALSLNLIVTQLFREASS